MSGPPPPPPRNKKTRMLSSLYNYTSSVAENHSGKHRGIAAGTAATLLGMSLDQVEKREDGGVRAKDGSFEYSEEELEQFKSMALSAEDHQKNKDKGHFMDRFMERLISHTIPGDSPDAEYLLRRMRDPSRNKKAPLSLRILSSNMKRLSAKMGAFFKIQYGIIHVITWRKPTKTLSVLVLYTFVCLWPHLVLAFPLLFLLFGMIIPAYLHRHPMDTPELLKVKKRGQTLLDFFNATDETSVISDMLDVEDDGLTFSVGTESTDSYHLTEKPESISSLATKSKDVADELNKKEDSKFVQSQVSMFMNMRDLQNLTTDVLNGLDAAEKASSDTIGFQDERLTTFIFYVVIAATSVVMFLGKYIPWRAIFIQTGWLVIILCHPKSKKFLVSLKKSKARVEEQMEAAHEEKEIEKKEETDPEELNSEAGFDRHDIIVDDSPEVRLVEIFELQFRNVLRHEWKHYAYTKRFFDQKDSVRLSGKRPHGVDNLGKVFPPPEWKFDFGYASNWRIDKTPEEFMATRSVSQTYLKTKDDENDGWIYDKLSEDQDSTVEFRRRRLYRECYRYARPVMKTSFA